MRTRSLFLCATLALGCGQATSDEAPEPPPVGGCRYVDREATCALAGIDGWSAESPTATVRWQASITGGQTTECSTQLTVAPAEHDAFEAHVRQHASIPCTVEVDDGGSCTPIGACRVHMPAFAAATWTGGARIEPR